MNSSKFSLTLALACAAIIFSLAVRAQAQTLSYLAVFNGVDGSGPSTVIQATDGNFYATTVGAGNGSGSEGNVVRITPTGEITPIYTFCRKANCADGRYPLAPPILGSDETSTGQAAGGVCFG